MAAHALHGPVSVRARGAPALSWRRRGAVRARRAPPVAARGIGRRVGATAGEDGERERGGVVDSSRGAAGGGGEGRAGAGDGEACDAGAARSYEVEPGVVVVEGEGEDGRKRRYVVSPAALALASQWIGITYPWPGKPYGGYIEIPTFDELWRRAIGYEPQGHKYREMTWANLMQLMRTQTTITNTFMWDDGRKLLVDLKTAGKSARRWTNTKDEMREVLKTGKPFTESSGKSVRERHSVRYRVKNVPAGGCDYIINWYTVNAQNGSRFKEFALFGNRGRNRADRRGQWKYFNRIWWHPPKFMHGRVFQPFVWAAAPMVLLWGSGVLYKAAVYVIEKFGVSLTPKASAAENALNAFGQSKARVFGPGSRKTTGVRYKDVAGIDFALDEIQEAVQMLDKAEEFAKYGAKYPKGFLLEGPPGVGKTLLAKAVATECGLPFFSTNGSEFVEMFEGMAATRMKDLFKRARKVEPAIIFIDEIDSIGTARTGAPGADTREREAGLMELLVQMDGFGTQKDKIMVMGATNLAGSLDQALLRPGRFDRVIRLDNPSESNRLKILKVHADALKVDRSNDDAHLRQIARDAVGYSGAELANLLNEAGIMAVRREQEMISLLDLEVSMDKVKYGTAASPIEPGPAKLHLSLLQAGRAVAMCLDPKADSEILLVTVRPKGGHFTRIRMVPSELGETTSFIYDFQDYQDMCALAVAARATELVFFGEDGVTTRTAVEMNHVTKLAMQIVMESGTHPDFPLVTMDTEMAHQFPLYASQVEACTNEMVETALFDARCLAHAYKDVILRVARLLHDKDTVQGRELREMVEAHTPAPIPQEWVDAHEARMEALHGQYPEIEDVFGFDLDDMPDWEGLDFRDDDGRDGLAVFDTSTAGRVGFATFSSNSARYAMLKQGHWRWLPANTVFQAIEGRAPKRQPSDYKVPQKYIDGANYNSYVQGTKHIPQPEPLPPLFPEADIPLIPPPKPSAKAGSA